jgi:error-prone DNA polymerase
MSPARFYRSIGAVGQPAAAARAYLKRGSTPTPGVAATLALAAQLIGFPRHLSQHVGGFVITNERLDTLVPIGNAAMDDRTFIEWDKDDLDALGILKIDVLALGMLSAIRRSLISSRRIMAR